jgi:glutaminyl-peptide cyclotransferase
LKRAPLLLLLLVALAAGAWFFFKGKPAPTPEPGSRVTLTAIQADLAAQFLGEKAYGHVKALEEIGPRPPASEGYAKALAYLEAEYSKLGWTTTRQTFSHVTPRGPMNFTNLIARHGAADWAKSVPVVIGGHLDSKDILSFRFTGANDGGSSTGVLMELARVLATDPAAAGQVELVLFDGEEALLSNLTPTDGLYGSKHYAKELAKRATWPSVGIVIDLVGDKEYPIQYNPDAPERFATAVQAAAKESGLMLETYGGQMIDDHLPLQNSGLETLHLIGEFQKMPYWHQAGDTLAVIDAEALEKTGRVVLRFLAGL